VRHDADHGKADKGCDGSGIAFEVAEETAVAGDPGEGAFDRLSLGQDGEAMQLCAFDDLQFPGAGLGGDGGHLRTLIAAIGEDRLDEREQATRPAPIWRRSSRSGNEGCGGWRRQGVWASTSGTPILLGGCPQ